MTFHTLPNHLDAEAAVLGGILFQPDQYTSVAELITAEDFYAPKHQHLFRTMMELESKGEPLDLITITAHLKDTGHLEEAGGAAYIAGLLDRITNTAHITTHARLISEASTRRRMIGAAQDIVRQGMEGSSPLDQYLDFSESRLYNVSHSLQKKDFVDLATVLKTNMAEIDTLYNRKEALTGVPTGFTDLDKLTSGLQPGELVIIAARPSMGKTSFVLNVATQTALEKKGFVAFFSLEMNRESLGLRILSAQSKVDAGRLRTGQLYESDWPKIIRAAGILSETQIVIDDRTNLGVMEMRSSCRRLSTRGPISLIIVDYLQLMRGNNPGRAESREKEISEISRGLKQLAKELRVPVVALSQLNRQLDSRPDKRPVMSDLRESGAIEQDADVIAFIYRDEVYHKDTDAKGIAEIIVAKQRNGPTGVVYLTWLNKYTRFENFAQSPQGMHQQPSDVLNQQPDAGDF